MAIRLPAFEPIEWLVLRRYPNFKIIDQFPRAFRGSEEERLRLLDEVAAYETELRNLPPEKLQALLEREKALHRAEIAAQGDREEAARFFNKPGAVADYSYWSKASYWHLEEAIALALGKNPQVVNSKTISSYQQISAFAKKFLDLLELVKRANAMKQVSEPCAPTVFLAWAKRMELEVSPELIAAVTARGEQIKDWKSLYDQLAATSDRLVATAQAATRAREEILAKYEALAASHADTLKLLEQQTQACQSAASDEISTREKDSLLKLVIGMAVKGYRYDPKAQRNAATSDIASDLEALGIALDADTVRKWLRQGAELLPPETE